MIDYYNSSSMIRSYNYYDNSLLRLLHYNHSYRKYYYDNCDNSIYHISTKVILFLPVRNLLLFVVHECDYCLKIDFDYNYLPNQIFCLASLFSIIFSFFFFFKRIFEKLPQKLIQQIDILEEKKNPEKLKSFQNL